MTPLETALKFVLKNEGGYTNDPHDSGGPTNWGITIHDYERYMGHPVTAKDVEEMPLEVAEDIYEAFYWTPLKLEKVSKPKLAVLLFDQAVNRGVKTAAKNIQFLLGLDQDGVVGPKTLAAINSCDEMKTGLSFIKLSQNSYVRIVVNKPSQVKFLAGWINRTHKLLDLLLTG